MDSAVRVLLTGLFFSVNNCCKVTVMTYCVSKQKWEVAHLFYHPR